MAVVFVAGMALLTGCSVGSAGDGGAASSGTASSETAAQSGEAQPTAGGGSNGDPAASSGPSGAQHIAAAVDRELRAVAGSTQRPSRQDMQDALVRAGIPAETLEISQDRTPTGLNVDAIEAAGQVEGQCVIGQIQGSQVSVTVLPVLDGGHCFVGDAR